MASPEHDVTIRQPLGLRAIYVAFVLFWISTAVRAIFIAHEGSVPLAILLVAVASAGGYRLVRLGVWSGPAETLTVHNSMRTRVFTRPEIEGFRLGTTGNPLGEQSLLILLQDGTLYRLDVGRTAFGLGKKQNARRLQQLTNWLQAPGV